MAHSIRLVSVLGLVILWSGCGLILHGSSQDVLLQSDPSGAQVMDGGQMIGRTPMTATFDRNETHRLTFRMDGYEDQAFQLNSGVDGVAIVGDILLGLVPLAIDFATGAMYKLSPQQAIVVMRRMGTAMNEPADADKVQVVMFTRQEVEAILGENALEEAEMVQE